MSSNDPNEHGCIAEGEQQLIDQEVFECEKNRRKKLCYFTFELFADEIPLLKLWANERAMTGEEAVIIIVNVYDTHGQLLAEKLMPGIDWQKSTNPGVIRYIKGIVKREGMKRVLNIFDQDAATELNKISDVAVVVVDHCVAEVFEV